MIKSIAGGLLIAFGAFFLLGFSVSVSRGASPFAIGNIIGVLVLSVTPIAGGGMLIRSHIKHKQLALRAREKDEYARHEKEIIRIAQKRGGRISIPEVVAETSMSTDEADQVLREMTTKGYVDMQVTESGVIVYEFYEIAHRKPLEE